MVRVMVLGLSGCTHCDALQESLKNENIDFEFVDANVQNALADRMEALLKTEIYPMVILEKTGGSVYLFRTDVITEVKESQIGYAKKIGCVSTDSMVAIIKKYKK